MSKSRITVAADVARKVIVSASGNAADRLAMAARRGRRVRWDCGGLPDLQRRTRWASFSQVESDRASE